MMVRQFKTSSSTSSSPPPPPSGPISLVQKRDNHRIYVTTREAYSAGRFVLATCLVVLTVFNIFMSTQTPTPLVSIDDPMHSMPLPPTSTTNKASSSSMVTTSRHLLRSQSSCTVRHQYGHERDRNTTTHNEMNIMLLRSIGNALPPRHDSNQAYNNLKFTLEHEQEFPNVKKHWVLNRIVDDDVLTNLTTLLEQHSKQYTIIPFDLKQYDDLEYQFQYYQPVPDPIHQISYVKRRWSSIELMQIDDAIQQDKNLYVSNQNAARNVMIDIGKSTPDIDWILPWDGNCFLHNNAYRDILEGLQSLCGDDLYAYVPMNRANSNDEILTVDYHPDPIEEPQVILHRSAVGRFQPNLRYGRRNKVEFLIRMGVKGVWDSWDPFRAWEVKHLGPFLEPLLDLKSGTSAKAVGWTTRLFSGRNQHEQKGALKTRHRARGKGMTRLLGRLDERAAIVLHGYRPGQLLYYNEEALSRDRDLYRSGDAAVRPLVESLVDLARKALEQGPWSVVDKPDTSPSGNIFVFWGDKHDYFSLDPSYTPASVEAAKDPAHVWIEWKGSRFPGTSVDSPMSSYFDQSRLLHMQYNTTILGLAYYMTGEAGFARTAARNIKTWFLDPATKMNPSMLHAYVRRGRNHNFGTNVGLTEMKDLYFLLDVVRMLAGGGFLTESDMLDLGQWFNEYFDWMETALRKELAYIPSHVHGIFLDIQAAAVAGFINDTAKMIWYFEQSKSRILSQIKKDGRMPVELKESNCEHSQMLTLQAYSTLARMAASVDIDLWGVGKINGVSSLCRAFQYAVPFYGRARPCRRSIRHEQGNESLQLWWLLFLESSHHCPTLREIEPKWPYWFPKQAQYPPQNVHSIPGMYPYPNGIAPFWNLGHSYVVNMTSSIGNVIAEA